MERWKKRDGKGEKCTRRRKRQKEEKIRKMGIYVLRVEKRQEGMRASKREQEAAALAMVVEKERVFLCVYV